MAHMLAAERQEQSPAHGVSDVPSTTQGWRDRGLAQERCVAAHAPELTRSTVGTRLDKEIFNVQPDWKRKALKQKQNLF